MAKTVPPKFRQFFKERTGREWPSVYEVPPAGKSWLMMISEAQADYMDLIAAKAFGEDLEG